MIAVVSGVVCEAIGLLAFRLNRQANDRLEAVNRDITLLNNTLLAAELVGGISDSRLRDRALADALRALRGNGRSRRPRWPVREAGMSQRMKLFRADPAMLRAPKSFEVDPLEYVAARIATAVPPRLSNEIEYLVYRASSLLSDESVPAAHRSRFLGAISDLCQGSDERARLNAAYVLMKLSDQPDAAAVVTRLRDAGVWSRLAVEFDAYSAGLPEPPGDPLLRAAWMFERTVPSSYLPPNMEPFRPAAVLIGPAEKRRRTEADRLAARATEAKSRADLDGAIGLLRSALALYRSEAAKYELAQCLTLAQRYGEAVTVYAELCRQRPSSARYHSAHAAALRGLGDDEQALTMLDRALELDPGRPTAVLNKASLWWDRNRPAEATAVLHDAIAGRSWTDVTDLDRGEAVRIVARCVAYALDRAQLAVAAELLRVTCELDPTEPAPWLMRAKIALDLGQLERVDELAEEALSHMPAVADARIAFAGLRAMSGEAERALADVDRVLVTDPTRPDALLFRARLTSEDLGNEAEAVPFYERYLAMRPEDGDIWNDLGCTLQRIDEHARALPCFKAAVRHRPRDPMHWTNLAHALLNEAAEGDDVGSVRQCLTNAAALRPRDVPALLALAVGWARIDEPKKARRWANRVLAHDPDNDIASAISQAHPRGTSG